MKRIIDIPDEMYDDIKHGYICSEYADTLIQLIPNSKPYEERSQGEWEITGETDEFYGRVYKCTHCGKEVLACACHNFCTWCGAAMR